MTIQEAIILGILQGITEFFPVSSSGHLEIFAHLLQIEASQDLLFSIIVHGATSLSTVIVLRKEILQMLKELFKIQWNENTQYITKIAISMIPVGIIGLTMKKQVESLFNQNLLLVGSCLLLTSTLLTLSYIYIKTKENNGNITYKKAFIIGIAQMIAILPGLSRSGATISAGLLLGIEKTKVVRFSFLMVLLPVFGATFLEIIDFIPNPSRTSTNINALLFGFVFAFISGIIACKWMLKLVSQGKLIYFAIWCALIGIITIITQL
ncbi:MAG: undecaprenyl-diphosphate phosphatase [Chitinophagaceae bacterium]|nr:undecaprenyl-diphosphate phosphatase [Chitinophagaceae bacterium]